MGSWKRVQRENWKGAARIEGKHGKRGSHEIKWPERVTQAGLDVSQTARVGNAAPSRLRA